MSRHNFDHLAVTPQPQITCVCCGAPLYTYYQPALVPTKDGHWLVECHQPDCALYLYTLAADTYSTLDLNEYLKEVR